MFTHVYFNQAAQMPFPTPTYFTFLTLETFYVCFRYKRDNSTFLPFPDYLQSLQTEQQLIDLDFLNFLQNNL
jgi:hypothetical protein